MSKFRILALEEKTMVEFMFPIDDMTTIDDTKLAIMYKFGNIDIEEVKKHARWNANSVGRDNVVFLRRCTTAHLEAIIKNVAHLDSFSRIIIMSILEERKCIE